MAVDMVMLRTIALPTVTETTLAMARGIATACDFRPRWPVI